MDLEFTSHILHDVFKQKTQCICYFGVSAVPDQRRYLIPQNFVWPKSLATGIVAMQFKLYFTNGPPIFVIDSNLEA